MEYSLHAAFDNNSAFGDMNSRYVEVLVSSFSEY